MNQEIVIGIVLSTMPMGEFDKRLVILTKEYGKISAFAKGARRQSSALLACSQPFIFGKFQIYMGRNSYTIMSVEVMEYYAKLRDNLNAVTYGFYFCEVVDYFTRENIESVSILKLIVQSLRALAKKTIDFPLIRYIFELKMMYLNGMGPQVFSCVHHREKNSDELRGFSSELGGLLCDKCYNQKNTILICPSTIYTLQYIASTPIEKLYTFRVSNQVRDELKLIMKDYLAFHLNINFKSLEILEGI